MVNFHHIKFSPQFQISITVINGQIFIFAIFLFQSFPDLSNLTILLNSFEHYSIRQILFYSISFNFNGYFRRQFPRQAENFLAYQAVYCTLEEYHSYHHLEPQICQLMEFHLEHLNALWSDEKRLLEGYLSERMKYKRLRKSLRRGQIEETNLKLSIHHWNKLQKHRQRHQIFIYLTI